MYYHHVMLYCVNDDIVYYTLYDSILRHTRSYTNPGLGLRDAGEAVAVLSSRGFGHEYTQFPSQYSGRFGPNPWKS